MCNAATIARVGRAGLAVLTLVILWASLAEAFYGGRTRVGANYQQTSNTTATDGVNESSCNGSPFCYVLFQRASKQKGLIIQHVSCRVSVSGGELRQAYVQTRDGQDFPFRRTTLVPVPVSGTFWAVSNPVMHLLKPGQRPVVFVGNSTAATWGIECSISGKVK